MSNFGKQFGRFIGFALVPMLIASSCPAGTIGQNRCMVLGAQLCGIVYTAKEPVPKGVGELAEKAQSLCLVGKTAQGLRAYAKALRIMGSQPVFPSEQQPNTEANLRIKS
jgi:hypothetical protein